MQAYISMSLCIQSMLCMAEQEYGYSRWVANTNTAETQADVYDAK